MHDELLALDYHYIYVIKYLHFLQIQGFLENFGDQCDDVAKWVNELVDYYPGFSEGWGVYSENPILMNDTDILDKHDSVAKYGLLKWQVSLIEVSMYS